MNMLSLLGLSHLYIKSVLVHMSCWLMRCRRRLISSLSSSLPPPLPNWKGLQWKKLMIIDHLSLIKDFQHFQLEMGSFANFRCCFSMPDTLNSNCFIWHQHYSLPYTKLLSFVACHITSKQLGLRVTERSWSDVKQIKDGKRSNLEGTSLEKQVILYTSARLK